jgi:carbamoylphosphate synthase small subunit
MIIEEGDIHNWLVKIIAWGEKLLLMRSHFLEPEQIVSMCRFDPRAKIELIREKGIAWVIISKNIDNIKRRKRGLR